MMECPHPETPQKVVFWGLCRARLEALPVYLIGALDSK
jgi:hypothetical protein